MKNVRTKSLLCAAMLLAGEVAVGKEVHLIAAPFDQIMPDGTSIPMWGFAEDLDGSGTLDPGESPSVPGPPITVAPDDPDGLTVVLHNQLDVPVSLMIPGQVTALQPVFFTDAQGRRRARSFTDETAPGATGTYSWPTLRPGSHVYHSGTHPQVQVQMGLYGGVTRDAGPGMAYPGLHYAHEAILFFSEIDPVLHTAVASGAYGTTAYPSSVDYRPKYFLINGSSFEAGASPAIPAGTAGEPTLLRLFNMGLRTHVPVIQGTHVRIVAEDSYPYPYPRLQYSISLPAAKTKDAVFVPDTAGLLTVYDRRLNLTDAGQPDGGMYARLEVGAAVAAPEGIPDAFATDEDTPLIVDAPGVLANDSGSGPLSAVLATPAAGSLSLDGDGSFEYLPPTDFHGIESFSYRADDGIRQSAPVTVTVTVHPQNDPPVAEPDSYGTGVGNTLTVGAPGVLDNDRDVDGDTLQAAIDTLPLNGLVTLNPDGGFTYTPLAGFMGDDSFSYTATDGLETSAPAIVAVTVNSDASPPTAIDDYASTSAKIAVTVNVVGNDHDPEGNLDPTSVSVTTPPRAGTAVANGNGTVTYTPNPGFRGSDAFGYTVRDTDGAASNEATVRIDVTK